MSMVKYYKTAMRLKASKLFNRAKPVLTGSMFFGGAIVTSIILNLSICLVGGAPVVDTEFIVFTILTCIPMLFLAFILWDFS